MGEREDENNNGGQRELIKGTLTNSRDCLLNVSSYFLETENRRPRKEGSIWFGMSFILYNEIFLQRKASSTGSLDANKMIWFAVKEVIFETMKRQI